MQNVPGEGIGFAAGQARHHGGHVAAHSLDAAALSAAEKTVRRRGLQKDDARRRLHVFEGKIARHRSRHRADARLQKHMRGRALHLLVRLQRHGQVALHDPQRDLRVAIPGGVLHKHPTGGLGGLPRGQAHAGVVIHIFHAHFSPEGADVVYAAVRRAFGHAHDGPATYLPRRPGYAAAMVAVCGGKKHRVLQRLAAGAAGERRIGDFICFQALAGGNVAGNGVRSAQNLEGVQPEARRFVLDPKPAQAKARRQGAQFYKRRGSVKGETLMEGARFPGASGRHIGKTAFNPARRARDQADVVHGDSSFQKSIAYFPAHGNAKCSKPVHSFCKT